METKNTPPTLCINGLYCPTNLPIVFAAAPNATNINMNPIVKINPLVKTSLLNNLLLFD
jgi:hypothetical protein